MKLATAKSDRSILVPLLCFAAWVYAYAWAASAAQQPAAQQPAPKPASASPASAAVQTFDTPKSAADALVKAAADFDQVALVRIFGPDGKDIVFSGEFPLDRKHAANFAQEAQEKLAVTIDPHTATRAFVLVGNEDWPFPVPLVKKGEKWSFEARPEARSCSIAASGPMNWMQFRSVSGTWKHRSSTLSSLARAMP